MDIKGVQPHFKERHSQVDESAPAFSLVDKVGRPHAGASGSRGQQKQYHRCLVVTDLLIEHTTRGPCVGIR